MDLLQFFGVKVCTRAMSTRVFTLLVVLQEDLDPQQSGVSSLHWGLRLALNLA